MCQLLSRQSPCKAIDPDHAVSMLFGTSVCADISMLQTVTCVFVQITSWRQPDYKHERELTCRSPVQLPPCLQSHQPDPGLLPVQS